MIIDIILIAVGLVGLLIASISDIRTREVPDWISYGLIFSGLSLRLLHSIIYSQWSYILYGILSFAVLFILSNIMFYAKQWGGGDTKLMMGVAVIFATRPFFLQQQNFPFILAMVVNILVIGAVYGVIYGIALAFRNWKKFIVEFKSYNRKKSIVYLKLAALAFAVITVLTTLLIPVGIWQRLSVSTLAILLLVYPYLAVFIKAVEKGCLYKQIPVKDLTPGDWVEQDVYKNSKLVYKKKQLGIEEDDIKGLIKAKVQKVLVKEGIPFIPPFFIGALITVLTGKIMFLL